MPTARTRYNKLKRWLKRHGTTALAIATFISVLINIVQMVRDIRYRQEYDDLEAENTRLSTQALVADRQYRQKFDALQLENTRLSSASLQTASEPQIVQQHIIISGREFRALAKIDWRAKILAGETTGFVETPLSNRFQKAIAASDGISIDEKHGTFLQILNAGTAQAVSVRLLLKGGMSIDVGTLSPRSSKYVLLRFEQERPYTTESAGLPAGIMYHFDGIKGPGDRSLPYTPPSAQSWIPSLSEARGMGSAIIGGTKTNLIPSNE